MTREEIIEAVRPLIEASAKAYLGEIAELGLYGDPDEEYVASPPIGITFGMVRAALKALA